MAINNKQVRIELYLISHIVFTWSNRQNEWYKSERRFIFTCKNDQERKKWVKAIRAAVAANKERL